ncbi:SMI1/KNR4 family protein [Hymenobacter wooponensis]|uniref:SMI1/KNR4 family protein n=1 Tax=Hymenobacter wooponensis TaxID=1525360 RepID=A0A4Z0MQW8_9BACT|nr:SMI1/KNR4 family protein [Hymenobacter wooponensis]TGD81810.1 SMI1/KNR4 family protein [Hymenobacter wooponensis]
MNNLSKLNSLWKDLKIRTVETATESQVAELEVSHNLQLPQDLRDYFTAINGTDGESDNELFSFYTLAQFQAATQVLGAWQNGIPRHSDVLDKIHGIETYYVFADYFISLTFYAIKLYPTASAENEVYAICGRDYKVIAKSFSEFIDMYLQQSAELII